MSNLSAYLAQAFGPQVSETLYDANVVLAVDDEMFAMITIIGGGGSGAKTQGSPTADNYKLSTGGNGGGMTMKLIRMKVGVDYTFVKGAGGAGITTATGANNGNNGSDSTFVSDDSIHDLTAYGGNGGNALLADTTSGGAESVTSPTAKSGIGGHFHFEGGVGGSIDVVTVTAEDALIATGGGAVNIQGGASPIGNAGLVDITGGMSNDEMATGGGGIGGRGGNITGAIGSGDQATGGGGTAGNAEDRIARGDGESYGGSAEIAGDMLTGLYMQPKGVGGNGTQVISGGIGADPGDGGGAGGVGGNGSTTWIDALMWGGGGGKAGNGSAGDGGLYGGGGGGLALESSSTSYISGAGSAGIMIVRMFAISRNIR
jgi:hypothetical protein